MKNLRYMQAVTLFVSALLVSQANAGGLTLSGPQVSEGNKWGFGSAKYDYATGKYVSPGIVWNGKGPAPEDGGAGVRELLSASPFLKDAALVQRADGSYIINTRGVPNSVTKSDAPVYVPATAQKIKFGSTKANTAAPAGTDPASAAAPTAAKPITRASVPTAAPQTGGKVNTLPVGQPIGFNQAICKSGKCLTKEQRIKLRAERRSVRRANSRLPADITNTFITNKVQNAK
ncbi:MAG: hypothetical protein KDD38_09540 [Bdellovibrionales bacterium]|nr:hypothetical protein [Bdellovibrionales bacterium]